MVVFRSLGGECPGRGGTGVWFPGTSLPWRHLDAGVTVRAWCLQCLFWRLVYIFPWHFSASFVPGKPSAGLIRAVRSGVEVRRGSDFWQSAYVGASYDSLTFKYKIDFIRSSYV